VSRGTDVNEETTKMEYNRRMDWDGRSKNMLAPPQIHGGSMKMSIKKDSNHYKHTSLQQSDFITSQQLQIWFGHIRRTMHRRQNMRQTWCPMKKGNWGQPYITWRHMKLMDMPWD